MTITMMRSEKAALLLSCVAIWISAALGEEAVRIVQRDQPTNFFGAQEAKLRFEILAAEEHEGRVQWRLTAAGRTLASRDDAVALEPGKVHVVEVRQKLPPVKEGVIFPLQLTVVVVAAKDAEPAAELITPLYLFAANPFADRKQWLESLHIQLFDPMETTSKAFTALEIPYASLTNLDTLADLKSGMLIVGEGVAWDEHGDFGEALLAAARRGVSVICLAPIAAQLSLPFAASAATAPASIALRRRDVIRGLDKRFSPVWSVNREVELRGLAIASEEDAIVGKSAEPGQGWPWIEIEYKRPQARLVWCGFGLIRSWDESPTPRYLLLRLMETLSPDDLKPKTP